jgi:hypothetical protein
MQIKTDFLFCLRNTKTKPFRHADEGRHLLWATALSFIETQLKSIQPFEFVTLLTSSSYGREIPTYVGMTDFYKFFHGEIYKIKHIHTANFRNFRPKSIA